MEVPNGWASLTSWGPMDSLRLPIYWLSILVGETEGLEPIWTGLVNLGVITILFPYGGLFSSVFIQFTAVEYLKTCAALRAASVPISFERIVRRACKVPVLAATPSAIRGAGGMTNGMISGMSRSINNCFGESLLVVSVSVSKIFLPSLIWVATNWSLLGSLSALSSSKL